MLIGPRQEENIVPELASPPPGFGEMIRASPAVYPSLVGKRCAEVKEVRRLCRLVVEFYEVQG